MKFKLSDGYAISARQAWHDAFVSRVSSIDLHEVLNSHGVQFNIKNNDKYAMSHCDKGKIQQVINNLKYENKIAWAWGMFAYAPDGIENKKMLINILLRYALNSVSTEDFNPFINAQCGNLAFVAINDAAVEAISDKRYRRKRTEMAAYCRCTVDVYEKIWKPLLFKMKDAVRDLAKIALPPVATVVWQIVEKQGGDVAAAVNLQKSMVTNFHEAYI